MKIANILSQVDLNTIALPEFQRGYVWNRDQVRGLMRSLYHDYPAGSLLTWKTRGDMTAVKGDVASGHDTVSLLLDGQQRITSLYGVMRGKPPKFFDGNARAFTGLYFNLDSEEFEFYTPQKMQNNPLWVNVTELYTVVNRSSALTVQLVQDPEHAAKLTTYITRLGQLTSIGNIDFHIQEIVGDKTVDTVLDIFNKVNSGGTKLSSGDLALAKVCAEWPEARRQLKLALAEWAAIGFHFKLDWLMRVVNAVITGEASFSALSKVTSEQFKQGLADARKAVNKLLNLMNSRLGMDSDQVLGSRYSFPLMARYVHLRGSDFKDSTEQDKLLYWYVHTFLWGRYAGSTESVLARDLNLTADPAGALDRLIADLRRDRGDLTVKAADFEGSTRGARFYPLLYMMTRVDHAHDWGKGIKLRNALIGNLMSLQVHHIFPQAQLKKAGYDRQQINALANFTFLTQETNLEISDRLPAEYLPEYKTRHPGAVESHWMPMKPVMWQLDQYPAFLAERRQLLADGANQFLNGLLKGDDKTTNTDLSDDPPVGTGTAAVDDAEAELLVDLNRWVTELKLPEGELRYELLTEQGPVTLDLAWPSGLQEGLSQPVAFLFDELDATLTAANQAGYLYFMDRGAFEIYVVQDILASGAPPERQGA